MAARKQKRQPLSIDYDEWMALLDEDGNQPRKNDDPDALTIAQIAELKGCTVDHARHMIRQALLKGRWEKAGVRSVLTATGVWRAVPIYRVKSYRKD